MPMSASAVVHRGELLELLTQLRDLLPTALTRADAVVADRAAVLEDGRREVERMREQALAERAELVAGSSVAQQAQAEADRLLTHAREQAEALRTEVEDYVDSKLANFEVVLSKTLVAVERGRARLSGHSELDELRD